MRNLTILSAAAGCLLATATAQAGESIWNNAATPQVQCNRCANPTWNGAKGALMLAG